MDIGDVFPAATGKAYLVPHRTQVKKIRDHDSFLPLGTVAITTNKKMPKRS
jgi:hypothetical protein